MSQSIAGPHTSLPVEKGRGDTLSLLLFLATAFALLLRFIVSPQLLNMAMNYTADQGSFYEKLHLGTYAICLLLPLAVFSKPILLRGDEIGVFKLLIRYCVVMAALVPYLFIIGRAGSSGFIIDTHLVAGAAGLLLLIQAPNARRLLGDIVVVMLIVSAVVGIAEAATHQRFLPYTLNEVQFRPIGLSAHPLALGAFSAIGIGFVTLTRWPVWLRILSIAVLFVGCAASGARFALLLASAEIVMLLLFVPWPQLSPRQQIKAKLVTLLLVMVLGAILIGVLFASGFMNRFGGTLFDENFMARVTIYRVFEFVSWKDLFFGMNDKALLEIVRQRLHLPYIESSPVALTLLFGLPIALLFAGLFFATFFRLLAGVPLAGRIAGIVFLLASLSNNALSSKTPELTIIVVLMLAYRRPPLARNAPRPAAQLQA